jgi:hypothetical protein
MKCASVSDVPGFIARGMGSDGICHYPLGSDDQTHPWFLGLHAYLRSGIPGEEERKLITAKMKEVAVILESTGWRCPCDGAFSGQFRGSFNGHLFRDAVRYLYILRAMYDITGEQIWLERYRTALAENPENSVKSRLEICAAGYQPDTMAIKGIDRWSLWIYVGSQRALAQLAAMETDESVKSQYRDGLLLNARNALKSVGNAAKFDNKDSKVFGSSNWREVYSTWFPQKTQAEAEKLSGIFDAAKKGERKNYEITYMRHPLAAAAIAAHAVNGAGQDEVEKAICHYDYSKLNMAEFFFAECAYYFLPEDKE